MWGGFDRSIRGQSEDGRSDNGGGGGGRRPQPGWLRLCVWCVCGEASTGWGFRVDGWVRSIHATVRFDGTTPTAARGHHHRLPSPMSRASPPLPTPALHATPLPHCLLSLLSSHRAVPSAAGVVWSREARELGCGPVRGGTHADSCSDRFRTCGVQGGKEGQQWCNSAAV